MPEEEAERTEPATPKRREEARRKGEVAQSREIGTVVILSVSLLMLGSFLGANVLEALASLARASWGGLAHPPEAVGTSRV